MQIFDIEVLKKILSKDMDEKSLNRTIQKTEEIYKSTLKLANVETWENSDLESKVKILMMLGFGRDRTINALSEYKINRNHIKSARENMNETQTEFRLESESFLTNAKIQSTKREKRLKELQNSNVGWKTIEEKYKNGEAIHKIAKEYGLKIHTINEHLKDEGIHDETRSTLLKNKKASNLENKIDDEFITELVKNNPLDSKDLWWEKAKEKYPWMLRKQLFDKLKKLGLERTEKEVNEIRSSKNKLRPQRKRSGNKKNKLLLTLEFKKPFNERTILEIAKKNPEISIKSLRKKVRREFLYVSMKDIDEKLVSLGLMEKRIISDQEIKENTLYKVNEVFSSLENLVELYMSNKLGSYSKITRNINENCKEGLEVSVRQVEKAISRHPNYKPRQSAPELQLYEFTKKTFPNYKVSREKRIPGTQKRMDILIEDLNVALEFNGDYYHSDEVIMHNYGKSSEEVHKERVEDAEKAGIKLVYVWERDWNTNFLEVEKAIANQDWNNPILNRHSNSDYQRKAIAPNPEKSTSRKRSRS